MSDLIAELTALMHELEQGDVLEAGTRLGKLTPPQREELLALAKRRPTARRRLTKLLGPSGSAGAALRETSRRAKAQLEQAQASWLAVLETLAKREGTDRLQEQAETLGEAMRVLGEASVVMERPEAWTEARFTELQRTLSQLTNLPTHDDLAATLAEMIDAMLPGEDGGSLCMKAVVKSWGQEALTDKTRDLWRQAHTRLAHEGNTTLLARATRVLQLDALERGDLDAVAGFSRALGDAGSPRQVVLSHLERALVAARMARADEAQGLVSSAIELTGDDSDLRAHARFVAGEIAWMSGDTAAAMRTWGDILTQHKTTPTPSGTCRAALGLAKAARQMGKHAEEQAAYRVAVHTALELQQPLLVEQAFLGWGRALQDAGEEGIEARLLAKLGEARSRYPRLVDALDGGILSELRTT